MPDNSNGYVGSQPIAATTNEYDAQLNVIRYVLSQRHHCEVVRVVARTDSLVDVHPLINMLDGEGNAIPHGVINDIPYIRWQAGTSGIILDPVEGDIGLAIICDRDISAVKATKDDANPGSMRENDYADGVYLGGLLNADVLQYILFNDDGIKIYSPTLIRMEAPRIEIVTEVLQIDASESTTLTTPKFIVNGETELNGTVKASSTIDAAGKITAPEVQGGGKLLSSHTHRAQGATAITTSPL